MAYMMRTEEIRGIMKRRGVTVEDLAEAMDVPKDRVVQILTGYQSLSDDNAIRIMDALDDLKKNRRVQKKT